MMLWQKPIVRTIPIFYRQSAATVPRRIIFSLADVGYRHRLLSN
jgi:hypothetical protein